MHQHANPQPPGGKLPTLSTVFAASCTNVSNDNVVQWEGRRFQITQQARRFSFAGAKVRIYQAHDGRISLYYGETRLQLAAMPGG